MSQGKPVFDTPEAAEAAYYQAFHAADLDGMMQVWAAHDNIVCIHPVGGRRLVGQPAVFEGWLNVFARELNMHIRLSDMSKYHTPELAVHSGVENISRSGEETRGNVLFTNVYEFDGQSWRMVLHHTTPGAGGPRAAGERGSMMPPQSGRRQLH